jgi:hypothetical protein
VTGPVNNVLAVFGLRLCGCREVMPSSLYTPDGKREDVEVGECRLCHGKFGVMPE